MGQHLGHLRALFRVMDNADAGVDLAPVSSSLARRDSLLNHLGYSPLAVTSSANHDYANVVVGQRSIHPAAPVHDYENVVLGTVDNAVQVDDIYEHIFGGGSEISAEENGNLVPAGVKASAMATRTECECDVHKASGGGARRSSHLSLVSSKRARAKLLRPAKETSGKKKRNNWVMKFNCARLKSGGGCAGASSETDIPEPSLGCESCVCTGYRRTEEHHLGAGVVFQASDAVRRRDSRTSTESSSSEDLPSTPPEVLIDMSKFNPEDFPIEDCDERARLERAREIAEGVEPPPGFLPGQHVQLVVPPAMTLDNLTALFQSRLGVSPAAPPALSQLDVSLSPALSRGVHTQVDYIHCLVPDLLHITSCSFYWGKMDRYEAERLLEGRPEGTFLLRDSAQEEYLFSVSFRKYGRSLHARIEQWNHHFSFDSHDPGVFASPTVCGLIEHYKDPACCMFFEPMLTIPLHRNFPFPLQHLCRAVVSSRASYDGISRLQLPKPLKGYLKEYHYKQRVRVRVFESEQ